MTTRRAPAASPATAASAAAEAPTVHVPAQAVRHEVRVVDGRFAHAECSCGWRGAGRRLRSTARSEAHDHALLYAGTGDLDLRG